MRKRFCAGNWKMFKKADEAVAYINRFLELADGIDSNVELAICPPFTALPAAAACLSGQDRVHLGAQNMHWEPSGAFTGEISAPMLREFGVRYVIIGHSERRQYFGESDQTVRLKTAAALAAGLVPIVAVGESLEIRDAGSHEAHVIAQTRAALTGLDPSALRGLVLAYEPIWAIGTGKNCAANDANAIMHAMRTCMPGLQDVQILYGGSVKPENVAAYTAQPDIDGALAGGASLDPDGFAALANAAA